MHTVMQYWIEPLDDEKDLDGGSIVVQDILGGIDACQEGVILVSPDSVKSQWVAFEIGALRAQRKRVTPILNGVSHDAISPMSDVKSIDLNVFEQYLMQVDRRRRRRSTNDPRQ